VVGKRGVKEGGITKAVSTTKNGDIVRRMYWGLKRSRYPKRNGRQKRGTGTGEGRPGEGKPVRKMCVILKLEGH